MNIKDFFKITMKTSIKALFALLLISSLSACSKKTGTSDLEKLDGKVRVAFTVSGFEQELVPFPKPQTASAEKGFQTRASSTTSTVLSDHINVLDIYVFYHIGDGYIDHVRQYENDPNFGTYENYFDPDVYTADLHVLFVGSQLGEGEAFEWVNLQNFRAAGFRIAPDMKEAFATRITTNLKNLNTDPVILKRAVGRLDLQLEEVIPADAGHLEITIEHTGKYFAPFFGLGFTETTQPEDPSYNMVKSISILPEQLGEESFNASLYFFLKDATQQSSVPIKVAAYDVNGTLIREVTLQDVKIQTNRITKIKGQIFTAPNMTHQIGLEGEWGEDFPVYEF